MAMATCAQQGRSAFPYMTEAIHASFTKTEAPLVANVIGCQRDRRALPIILCHPASQLETVKGYPLQSGQSNAVLPITFNCLSGSISLR